jgi:hypothetical protein
MSLNLYHLEPQYAALAELPLEIDDAGDGAAAVHQALEAIRDEARDKALALAKVVKCLDAEVRVLEEHTRLLQSKVQARRDRVEYLRKLIRLELEAAGLDGVKDPFITVWLQLSPPSVDVIDEQSVPPEFMRAVLRLPYGLVPSSLRGHLQHLDVDRAAILELVKRTGEIPSGVEVHSNERHLRIR